MKMRYLERLQQLRVEAEVANCPFLAELYQLQINIEEKKDGRENPA